MSYDIERTPIYRQHTGEIVVDGLLICKRKEVEIVKETPGDFVVTVKQAECDLGPPQDDRIVITKEMLAAMNAAAQ